MTAAILGVNGYLGSNLAYVLKEAGFDIYGYGMKQNCNLDFVHYEKINIVSEAEVEKLKTDVDLVFFFSSKTGILNAYEHSKEFIDTNENGLLNVLNLLRKRRSNARVIFPSTRLIYSGQKDTPLKEDAPKEFKSIYSLTKWFGEQVLDQYARYFGVEYSVYRICVPYGDITGTGYSYGTVGFFMKQALSGADISLYGDGSLRRTFTHVYDVCKQILLSVQQEKSKNSAFNIGGETFSLLQIGSYIAEKYGVGVKQVEWPSIDLLIESGDTIFDDTKLKSLVIFQPRYNFIDWLGGS